MSGLRELERQDEERALLMLVMHVESMSKDLYGADAEIIKPLKHFKHSLIQELVDGDHSTFGVDK
jgi:hypothetical protein